MLLANPGIPNVIPPSLQYYQGHGIVGKNQKISVSKKKYKNFYRNFINLCGLAGDLTFYSFYSRTYLGCWEQKLIHYWLWWQRERDNMENHTLVSEVCSWK